MYASLSFQNIIKSTLRNSPRFNLHMHRKTNQVILTTLHDNISQTTVFMLRNDIN